MVAGEPTLLDLTHPERLWWLAALPLLWILARPLRPKAIVATPYLALWKRAQERLRRRPLRVRWLRLVLLALAFATALLAFAGARSGHRSGPTQLSILLDTSASMAARQGPAQATALDQAKAKIRERLTRLPAELVVTLTAVGGTSAPVSRSLGRDPGWLATLMPGTGPGAVGLAALASRVATPECLVWTLTDGLLPTDVPKIGALSLVGAPGGNLAITRVAIADAWPLPEIRVQVEVQNASAGSRVATLAVSGGAVATNSDLQLAEGASVTATLELRRTIGGSVKIALVPSTEVSVKVSIYR